MWHGGAQRELARELVGIVPAVRSRLLLLLLLLHEHDVLVQEVTLAADQIILLLAELNRGCRTSASRSGVLVRPAAAGDTAMTVF